MIAEQLKKSILQAAIQGKLTQQLPEDGDARDLLQKIKKEKVRLIKEGKIKKEKPLPAITEDEIPFEIPENWCWVRLGQIMEINPRNKIDDLTSVSFVPMSLINDGYSNTFSYQIKLWKDVRSGFTHFANNDVVVAKITPCFQNRKSAVMRDLVNGYGAGTTELHVLRPILSFIISEYFLYLTKTEYFVGNGVQSMTGTAGQQRVGKSYIENFICPLPPIAVQERIVKRLEEFLPEIEKLNNDEAKLEELQKSFPKKMKDAILQYAIQGKLTQQLPEDGDARDLLKEIQKEKARLIKEGKIKKEKPLPEITEDEIPFEIPENWCWVRLGEIGETNIGLTYAPSDVSESGTLVLRSGNIQDNKIVYFDNVYVSCKIQENKLCSIGDILICARNGSKKLVGKAAIIDEDGMSFGAFMALYRSPFNQYIHKYLNSPYFRADFDGVNTTTINQITQNNLKERLLPLPPVPEQKRIIEILENILPSFEELE